MGFPNGSAIKNPPAMQETQETWIRSLGGKDPLGGGNGNLLQYSSLGNPMDRGAWQATVHGVPRVRNNWATQRQKHPELCGNTQTHMWAWLSNKQKQKLGCEDEREVPSLSRSTQTVSSMRVRTEREGGPWHPAQRPRQAGEWKPSLKRGASHLFGEASPQALVQRPPPVGRRQSQSPQTHPQGASAPLHPHLCHCSGLVFSASS